MFRRSVAPVMMRNFLTAMMNNLDSVAGVQGLLNTSEIGLFTNAYNPNPDSLIADFTEATFAGYAPVASVTWVPAGNVGNTGLVLSFQAVFTGGAVVLPGENIEGYTIRLTGGAGAVYIAERFATPVPIVQAGDFLSLDAQLELKFAQTVTQV